MRRTLKWTLLFVNLAGLSLVSDSAWARTPAKARSNSSNAVGNPKRIGQSARRSPQRIDPAGREL